MRAEIEHFEKSVAHETRQALVWIIPVDISPHASVLTDSHLQAVRRSGERQRAEILTRQANVSDVQQSQSSAGKPRIIRQLARNSRDVVESQSITITLEVEGPPDDDGLVSLHC
jgi:hypothetical protein